MLASSVLAAGSVEKKAEKEQTVIKVDFARGVGTFKPLNGVSLAPVMTNIVTFDTQEQYYRKLNIQGVRLHDDALNNKGYRVVDIHQIFRDPDADPADPKNYYFKQTDDYLKPCAEAGIQVLYRLGESIEHSACKYFIDPPKDFEKWAEICCRIAEHYTRGWANGFHWTNMKDWQVWCEPNEPKLWTGSYEEYLRLYEAVAKKFAERLPELRIGGPSLGGCNLEKIEGFLKFCREKNLKLDFIIWNQYCNSIKGQLEQPGQVRAVAEKYGYGKVALQIGEWHCLKRGWNFDPDSASDDDDLKYGMNGFEAAAYTAAVLAGWQDEPLEKAYFYTGSKGKYGIFDNNGVPKKTAFALEAYGRVLRCPERVAAHVGRDVVSSLTRERMKSDLRVLAGRNGNECVIMISAYRCILPVFEVEVSGLKDFDVSILVTDKEHDQAPAAFIRKGNVLEIMKHSSSAVYMIHLHCR